MKILELQPVSLAEVKENVKNMEEKKLDGYLKKFGKLDLKKANELADEIRKLDNMKIKEEDIMKNQALRKRESRKRLKGGVLKR